MIVDKLTEVRRDVEDHVGAADPNTGRRTRTNLGAEAVQQQVQTADWSLDALVGFLWSRQPAERSAAGAPREVTTLQQENKHIMNTSARTEEDKATSGGVNMLLLDSPCGG